MDVDWTQMQHSQQQGRYEMAFSIILCKITGIRSGTTMRHCSGGTPSSHRDGQTETRKCRGWTRGRGQKAEVFTGIMRTQGGRDRQGRQWEIKPRNIAVSRMSRGRRISEEATRRSYIVTWLVVSPGGGGVADEVGEARLIGRRAEWKATE